MGQTIISYYYDNTNIKNITETLDGKLGKVQ